MRKFSLILLAMVGLGVTGCAVGLSNDYAILKTPPAAQDDDKMATVVFLRRSNYFGREVGYYIWSKGEKVCALANGTYCRYNAKPGAYAFYAEITAPGWSLTTTGNERQLSVEAGKTYYIASSIAFKSSPTLVLIPEGEASQFIKDMKYLQLNK
jgi:hypothetical protein